MDEGEASSKVSLAALSTTFTRIKKQLAFERQAYVKAKMEANSEKIQGFCKHLLSLSSSRVINYAETDMLSTRIQKALNKLGSDPASSSDQQSASQDDSSAPILFNNSGGKSIVCKRRRRIFSWTETSAWPKTNPSWVGDESITILPGTKL